MEEGAPFQLPAPRGDSGHSRLLQDALDRCSSIRAEITQLKAQALTLPPTGAAAPQRPAGPKPPLTARPDSPALAEPAPSAQASVQHNTAGLRGSGEQQVPPKTVDSEQWTIPAFPASDGAAASPSGSAAVPAPLPAASSGKAPVAAPAKLAGQALGSRHSTFNLTADASVAALATALAAEQRGGMHAAGAGGAGRPSLQRAEPGQGRQQLGSQPPPQQQQQGSTAPRLERQWSESRELRRLLQNLEQANAVKQASDARMRRGSAVPPGTASSSLGGAGGGKLVVGAKVAQRQQPAPQPSSQKRPPPRERTQPFVPRPVPGIQGLASLGSRPAATAQPSSARRRESHFSVAGLVSSPAGCTARAAAAPQQGPRAGAMPAAAAAGYAQSPHAAKTGAAVRAAGGVLSPGRTTSLRPAAQQRQQQAAEKPRPQPAEQPARPAAAAQSTGAGGARTQKAVEPSAWSRSSDVPLRTRFSSLSSAGGSLRGGDPGETLAAPAATAAAPGPAVPAMAAAQTSDHYARVPSAPTAPKPTSQQQQQLTPRQRVGAGNHQPAAPGGIMRLLGKLSPFGKLQSPPATPLEDAEKQQGSKQAHPERGTAKSPPPRSFPDLAQAASSVAPADAAAGAAASVAAPPAQAPGGRAAAPAEAEADGLRQQQPPAPPAAEELEEASLAGAHAGMKRAPDTAIEQSPSSHKKRTPPPSRGPSREADLLAFPQLAFPLLGGVGEGSAAPSGEATSSLAAGGLEEQQAPQAREGQQPAKQQQRQRAPSEGPKAHAAPAVVGPVCAIRRSPVKQPTRQRQGQQHQGPAGSSAAAAAGDPSSPLVPPRTVAANLAAAGAGAREQHDGDPPAAAGSPPASPRLLPQASTAGRSYAQMHYARDTLSSASKKWSPSASPPRSPSRSPSFKPPSTVVPPPGSPPPPLAMLRSPSMKPAASYAQQAAIRQGSQQGHGTTRVTTASTEAHSVTGWGPAQQPPPTQPQHQDGGTGGAQGTVPSPQGTPEKELPSESTWQPGPRAASAGTVPAQAYPSPARNLDAQSVTVLIGGIHAVHRQRQMERAASGSMARRLSSAGSDAAAAAAAAGAAAGEAAEPAAGGAAVAAAAAEQQRGPSISAMASGRPSHARQPSIMPPAVGVAVREDVLGRDLLAGSQQLGDMAAGQMLELLKEGRLVRKSWVRSEFKQGGSTRLMQCTLGSGGRPVLQYPHGIFRKPLHFAVKRVIIPSGGWRPEQYLVVDTERGMLRLKPGSKQQYALWVLGLNAALTLAQQRAGGGGSGGDGSLQLVGDLHWNECMLIG